MQRRIYQPVYQQATGPARPAPATARPWGVQLAAHYNPDAALAIFARLKKQYTSVLAEQEPTVVRHRNPGFGRKARYAVRVGFESFAEAEKLCDRLRARGGACGVTRNEKAGTLVR
jgi:cell division septation protein DedD